MVINKPLYNKALFLGGGSLGGLGWPAIIFGRNMYPHTEKKHVKNMFQCLSQHAPLEKGEIYGTCLGPAWVRSIEQKQHTQQPLKSKWKPRAANFAKSYQHPPFGVVIETTWFGTPEKKGNMI